MAHPYLYSLKSPGLPRLFTFLQLSLPGEEKKAGKLERWKKKLFYKKERKKETYLLALQVFFP